MIPSTGYYRKSQQKILVAELHDTRDKKQKNF